MKANIFIFVWFFVFFLSCKENENKKREEQLNRRVNLITQKIKELDTDTLILFQENAKCGEWGGDISEIKIYYDSLRNLTGYYSFKIYNCKNLEKYINRLFPDSLGYTRRKVLLKNQVSLLESSIRDLLQFDDTTKDIIAGNSGVTNKIIIHRKNGTNIILFEDWPSFYWNNFHKLKKQF